MENTTVEKREVIKKKVVTWEFNRSTGIISVNKSKSEKADREIRFSFKLEIYKDTDTHEESIKITNYKDGQDNGFIVTSIMNLESDIKQFKKFGVVIELTYFRDLCKRIEAEYENIPVMAVSLGSDPRTKDLIAQVIEYVTDCAELITEDFCYIPVNEFNNLAMDCEFNGYEMKALRKQLAADKYIHVLSGRYAILVRVKDKPERVIAFYRNKLGVEVPIKPIRKSEKMSGTDEK